MSRKNKWRTQGALQFQRKTCRYYDGSPSGGDVLFIRIKGKACVYAHSQDADDLIRRPGMIWANDGLAFCNTPVKVGKLLLPALRYRANLYKMGSRNMIPLLIHGAMQVTANMLGVLCIASGAVLLISTQTTYRKVGGLHFVRLGRIGFSCYLSRKHRR